MYPFHWMSSKRGTYQAGAVIFSAVIIFPDEVK